MLWTDIVNLFNTLIILSVPHLEKQVNKNNNITNKKGGTAGVSLQEEKKMITRWSITWVDPV